MISVASVLGQKPSYASELNTDEWRAFARAMRNAKGNACESCRQGKKELHVHHLFYESGKKAWEANPSDVVVLCKECHHGLHEQLQNFRKQVFKHFKPADFRVLNEALAVAMKKYHAMAFACAVAEMAASPNSVERFFVAWTNRTTQKLPTKAE